MIGIWESIIILIAIVLLVLWLGKKSPEMARTAGKSIAEFKQGLKELPKEVDTIKEEIKK
jgi:Sec-independent protein translocase protein TatA